MYFRTKVCSLIYLCIYHILYTHVYACVVLYTLTRNVDVYKSETRLSFKKPWIVFFFTAFKKFQACLALQWAKNYSKEGKGVLHYCICGCVYVCVCICMYMSVCVCVYIYIHEKSVPAGREMLNKNQWGFSKVTAVG